MCVCVFSVWSARAARSMLWMLPSACWMMNLFVNKRKQTPELYTILLGYRLARGRVKTLWLPFKNMSAYFLRLLLILLVFYGNASVHKSGTKLVFMGWFVSDAFFLLAWFSLIQMVLFHCATIISWLLLGMKNLESVFGLCIFFLFCALGMFWRRIITALFLMLFVEIVGTVSYRLPCIATPRRHMLKTRTRT